MTTPTTVLVQLKLRSDTAANWTSANPTLLAGELGRETDTGKIKIGTGSTAWTALAYQPFGAPITNADISATAEIAVSKLADGTARQLLQTDAAGTGVEWASDIDIPGTLDVTGAATFDNAVTITGDLTVNGTTTNINTTNLVVEDKNIILGDVATPSDVTADGGGITLKGATDKTINWVDATDAWTSSERFSVPLGTAALPSLTFTGDTNTGVYSPGADQVAISTGGTGRLFVDASGNVTVDTNTFCVDATNNRVGIGISAPGALLHLSSATGSASPTPTELRIATSTVGSDWSVTDPWGRISFYNADGSASGPKIHAAIDATSLTSAGGTSDLVFRTNNNLSDTLEARMVIKGDSSAAGARVGIGVTSPGGTLDIKAAATLTPLIVQGPSSEFARIDSSGKLLIGSTLARANFSNSTLTPQLQVEATTTSSSSIALIANGSTSANNPIPIVLLGRSRGTFGTNVLVSSGDALGSLSFQGNDGSEFVDAAYIRAFVDGTAAADVMPGRLAFFTTADGASSPTERLRITNDGVQCYNQAAPVSYAAAATLVIGDLKNGLVQYTGAAATLTLPTGTLTEGGFSGVYINMTFEWSVINTGSGTCTIGNGTGHTVTGSATVAAGASGRFASRRTAANTFVSYRLS